MDASAFLICLFLLFLRDFFMELTSLLQKKKGILQ